MPEKPDQLKLTRLDYVPSYHLNPLVPIWVDGAIKKSLSINPGLRYDEISEFIHDLTRPNPLFLGESHLPLIQRNPLVFWRAVSGLMIIINLILIYLMGAR